MSSEILHPGQPGMLDVTEAARIRLGASADTPADLLRSLAADADISVRAAVALNRAAPQDADHALARDPDIRVRMVLARKLATLIPRLPDPDHAVLSRHAWDNLAVLVEDEGTRVRQMVAELVKDLPDAPRSLIMRLARDSATTVSDPILRLSPALTHDDLLALLACAPAEHTAGSIARRTDISEDIADVIARSANSAAIRCLLQNHAASIRESTLDALIDQARLRLEWHEPLVRRPTLSARNTRLLSDIVTEQLLGVLAERPDLDPSVVADLQEQLATLRRGRNLTSGSIDQLQAEAHRLKSRGVLTEARLIEAIRSGQTEQVQVLLAVSAGVSLQAVVRAGRIRSTKAVVSLVWRAGFSMRIAGAVQAVLCNATPDSMLRPSPSGGFPLTEDEMRWQLEFVTHGKD